MQPNSIDILDFLRKQGIHNPSFYQIKSGRNSRVWRVEDFKSQRILKLYQRYPEDSRDRVGTEFRFLQFLHENGIKIVPKPLACDHGRDFALYSLLPGSPVKSITKSHIDQAADFIVQVNSIRSGTAAKRLPIASEACFSIKEHLKLVKKRVQSLVSIVAVSSVHHQVLEFAKKVLTPAFKKVSEEIHLNNSSTEEHSLKTNERILSPSDFGFHNTLQARGLLKFLDFEYAGWDDPAKLICDFTCHPEHPVSTKQSLQFGQKVVKSLDLQDALLRAQILLPLYRLKWCCIILNVFIRHNQKRIEHAGDDLTHLLKLQFEKANCYFNLFLKEI